MSRQTIPGRDLILVLILVLLLMSGGFTYLYVQQFGTGQLPSQSVRFFFTCLICWFLYKGHSWARWLLVLLLSIGVFIGVFGSSAADPTTMTFVLVAIYSGIVLSLSFAPHMKGYFTTKGRGETAPPRREKSAGEPKKRA
jgi:hypothetical protein